MKKENPGGFSFFIGAELRIRVKRGKVKRRHKKIFAGAVYHSDTVASRLRRVNRICSSRIGENCVEVEKWAHTVRPYGRQILCRFSFRSGCRSLVCARLSNKKKLESQEDSTHLIHARRGNKV